MKTTNILSLDKCIKGNGVCIGNGEVLYCLYYNGTEVGEVTETNGTQPFEKAGICTGLTLRYKYISEIPEGYSAKCDICGEVYFSCDDRYRNEWPNSSDIAKSQAYEEHMNEHQWDIYFHECSGIYGKPVNNGNIDDFFKFCHWNQILPPTDPDRSDNGFYAWKHGVERGRRVSLVESRKDIWWYLDEYKRKVCLRKNMKIYDIPSFFNKRKKK